MPRQDLVGPSRSLIPIPLFLAQDPGLGSARKIKKAQNSTIHPSPRRVMAYHVATKFHLIRLTPSDTIHM